MVDAKPCGDDEPMTRRPTSVMLQAPRLPPGGQDMEGFVWMNAICNDVVREGWRRAADEIREPLRRQMRENLGPAGDLDSWMNRMLANNMGPSTRHPDDQPLRRAGSSC